MVMNCNNNARKIVPVAAIAIGLFCSATAAQRVIEVRKVYLERPPRTVAIVERVTLASDTIHLYRDLNFADEAVLVNVSGAQPAGQAHDLPAGMRDSVSSMRWSLPPGVLVVMYEDSGAKGEQLALWGSGQIDSMATFDFNDKASQWAWYYVGGASGSSEAVLRGAALPVGSIAAAAPVPENTLQLFKSKNFEANTVTLNPLTSQGNTLHRLPEDLPDSLTSMRWNLPPGVVLILHQDADGGKQQVPIWGSGQVADLDVWDFNDKASRWAWHYIGAPEVVEVVREVTPSESTVVVVESDAIDLVSRAMVATELEIESNDLMARKNPVGEGTFVYVPKTHFKGVDRRVIWIVIDNNAYALTGPAKMATPTLATPEDAGDAIWARTGISKLHAEQDAVKIVFADR